MTKQKGFWGAGALAVVVACGVPDRSERPAVGAAALERAPAPGERFERTFPWGTGRQELRRTPRVPESVVYGPNAVAVARDGRPLVLDRLNGRVVAVDATQGLQELATVPQDVEDITVGADGAWLAWSPVRSRVAVFDGDGRAVGELAVPRELVDALGFDLGPSRRVRVRTGYQETLELGSPSAPLPLPVVLRTRREGAYLLADGRGVAVRAGASGAALVVLSQPADEAARAEVQKELVLPGAPTAARVIGGEGSVVCVKSERVTSTPALGVSRRASCVDVASGAVVFDEALPPPGIYVPRTEVAFGAGRLAFIHPTEKGLTVTSIAVLGKEAAP